MLQRLNHPGIPGMGGYYGGSSEDRNCSYAGSLHGDHRVAWPLQDSNDLWKYEVIQSSLKLWEPYLAG